MCVCVCAHACRRSFLNLCPLSLPPNTPFFFFFQINSCYGKVLSQNLNFKNLEVVTSAKELRRSLSKVTFERFCPVTELSGVCIHKRRKQLATTPLHLAYGILQSSKLIVLKFFFEKLRNSFLHNSLRCHHMYSDSKCAFHCVCLSVHICLHACVAACALLHV